MESSDDNYSFVWTDASSANEESADSSEVTMNTDKHHESESESSYKKKLHKKLFKTECEVKQELLHGTQVKNEEESEDQKALLDPINSSVKKRKRKRERTTSLETKPFSEHLKTHVKQESYTTHTNSDEGQDSPPKKKKLKRKRERQESEQLVDDKFSDEGTIVEERPQNNSFEHLVDDKFSAEETIVEERPLNNSSSCEFQYEETIEKISKKEKKKKKKKRNDSKTSTILEIMQKGNSTDETETQKAEALIDDYRETSIITSSTTKQTKSSNISDRIQFENGNVMLASEGSPDVQSNKLRNFLKVNPHLQLLTSCNPDYNDSLISQDDDIWLFNCPHEMNVGSLKDSNFSLDNKCKIKIDSQTFVGNVESEINRAAILTFENNKPITKSLEVNGIVNFHKRIPKAHFTEDNVMANDQTNFISLPDMKRRHPLFGPDYEKAIKIPSRVKSRLENLPLESPQITNNGKKKKKKRKYEEMSNTEDNGHANEDAHKHNRQLSERFSDQPPKKKSKRIKQEATPETWDSEKAIEENLFNY